MILSDLKNDRKEKAVIIRLPTIRRIEGYEPFKEENLV